jgi:hypothetical protein
MTKSTFVQNFVTTFLAAEAVERHFRAVTAPDAFRRKQWEEMPVNVEAALLEAEKAWTALEAFGLNIPNHWETV